MKMITINTITIVIYTIKEINNVNKSWIKNYNKYIKFKMKYYVRLVH